jgi:Heterokaryon incompatibility protein (HET)
MAFRVESEPFKYRSLTGTDSFRLILLEHSLSHNADLRCSLVHTSLSQCDRDIIDHYTALSYVWGDPTRTGSVYVDGHRFTITATLEAALRDLRDPSRVLRIWADALCIDQSNLAERSSQVGLMAQIYSIAHHTVIHLGSLTQSYGIILQATPSNTSGVVSKPSGVDDLRDLAANSLLTLPWFSRVWIFQELILSRDPWVQCGKLRARWKDLCNLLIGSGAGNSQKGQARELQVLADMNYARGLNQEMIVHLTARRGLGATDPRDFIFAHMFLASDINTLIRYVKVDYTQSCAEVFEEAARFLLEEIGPEGPIKFFPDAIKNQTSNIEGLASWAPDWSLPSSGLVSMYYENLTRRLQLNPKCHYAFVSRPLVLAYVGYQVDIVSDFSFVLPDPSELDIGAREKYQKVAEKLEILYGAGAWWSGDETGQHRHVSLRGKEAQHEELCLSLAEEWLHVMSCDLLVCPQNLDGTETEAHERFLSHLRSWLQARAKEGRIMVGSDSDGMESLMWLYLRLADYPAVLTGRRLATTQSGKIGVLPKHARVGDIVVFLAGTYVSLLLRPDPEDPSEDLRHEIKSVFEAKKHVQDDPGRGTRLPCDMENLSIQKCTFVGECYVEGEVGWKYGEVRTESYTVYALR